MAPTKGGSYVTEVDDSEDEDNLEPSNSDSGISIILSEGDKITQKRPFSENEPNVDEQNEPQVEEENEPNIRSHFRAETTSLGEKD